MAALKSDKIQSDKSPFDWSPFFGSEGGQLFQRLCVDLLKAMDLTVRESVRGGHDEGKDIIIFECPNVSWLEPPKPACFVECKSRQPTAKALSKADVHGTFLAVFKHKLNRILIMTNHEFNNELMNYFLDVNSNEHWGLKVTWMERSQLEGSLRSHPDVCRSYFNSLPVDIFKKGDGGIIADLKPLSPFYGLDNQLRLVVTNTFHETVDITVARTDTSKKHSFKLHPFEARAVAFPLHASTAESWPSFHLSGTTPSGRAVTEHCSIDGRPLIRVDHLYVDPFGYINRLLSVASESGCSLILGKAGSGKSRLLLEVAARMQRPLQWIDLSEDSYANSLSEHLLAAIFRLARSDLTQMPAEILEQSLASRGIGTGDAATLTAIARRSAQIDHNAAAETIAAVSCQLLAESLVVIDNIHRIGTFDTLILQRMSKKTTSLRLMLSARGNEIERAELNTWVEWLARVQQQRVIDLDEVDRRSLLEAFIATSAQDQQTESFLRRFAGAPSLQEFIFTLKELKAHEFLIQDGKGHFSIGRPSRPVSQRTYQQLYQSLISAAGVSADLVRMVLDAAAVYGLTFPVEFVQDVAGADGHSILEQLVRLEMFVPLPAKSAGGRLLRFDHELTHDIVYNAIGVLGRDTLHKKAASFVADPSRFRIGVDSAPLARHLEYIGAYREAANRYQEAATFLKRESQLAEALDVLRMAHSAIVQHHQEFERHELEFAILEDTLRIGQRLGVSVDELRRTLAALDILVLLRSAQIDMRAEAGRLLGYRSDLERDGKAARHLAEAAVQSLEKHGTARDTCEALLRLSILSKLDGHFKRAAQLTARAIRLARKLGLEDLRASALLDFGAVFLEAQRGWKVPLWWKRAVLAAARANPFDIGIFAHALTDQSYAFALFRPSDVETSSLLEQAYYISKTRRLAETECRAALNWANWCYFHLKDVRRANTLLDEAQRIAVERNLSYHAALVAFSRMNFLYLHDPENGQDLLAQLRAFLSTPDHSKGGYSGDWRTRNITALLLALGDQEVWALAEAADAERWRTFYGIGIGAKLAALETANPYFQGNGYATYY